MDARELSQFYKSAMGQRARRVILPRLRQVWPNVKGQRLLGYGFAIPYLQAFLPEAERGIAVSPAEMGVIAWPAEKCLATLAEEDSLPFPDAFFDRILVVHGLEGAQSLRPLLRQLWRVLAPEGKLLLVAPNRASLWAQVERTPFGEGRPFSRRELDILLKRRCSSRRAGSGRFTRRPSAPWLAAASAGNGLAGGFFPASAACTSSRRASRSMLPPRRPLCRKANCRRG